MTASIKSPQHPAQQTEARVVGVACRRQDRAPIWLVTSQRNQEQQYMVVQVGTVFHCTCLAGQHRRARCIHREVVRRWLTTRETQRRAQEQQRHEAAARRERALLWTDDRPFSLYKS